MVLPTRPELEMPHLSGDIGDLSDGALMKLYNEHVQWANFMAVQVAKADIEEDDAEAALTTASAKYMILNAPTGRDDKVTIIRAQRDADPEVVALSQKVREAKAFRKMVTTIFTNLERSTAAISRELSRRIGLAPAQGRTHNWGGA